MCILIICVYIKYKRVLKHLSGRCSFIRVNTSELVAHKSDGIIVAHLKKKKKLKGKVSSIIRWKKIYQSYLRNNNNCFYGRGK